MKMRTCFIILFFAFLYNPIFSQSYTEDKVLEFWADIGHVAFIEDDFDQNGELDFLADVNGRTQIIIGDIKSNKVQAHHSSQMFERIDFIKYIDIDEDDNLELFVVDGYTDSIYQLSTSTLETINATTLAVPSSFSLFDLKYDSFIDGEPKSWFAISQYEGGYELSPSDFSVIQQLPDAFEAREMYIGNFDTDPEKEICLIKNTNNIQILNTDDYSIEYQINKTFQEVVIEDTNGDGIVEIMMLSYSDLLHYDFSNSNSISEISDISNGVSNIYVHDFDGDQISEILVYDDDEGDNDLTIVKTNPLAIDKKIDLPYNSQNYSGEIIATDRFINPTSQNLLFSGRKLYSVNPNTGFLEGDLFSISNIALTNFDYYTNTDEKQLILSDLEENTGEAFRSTNIVNFNSRELEQIIYPNLFDPESNSPNVHADIKSIKFPGQATSDLILTKSFQNELSFYSPSSKITYNRNKFKFRNYQVEYLDNSGYPELVNFEYFDDEITFYTYSDKYTWEQRLKVLSGSQLVEFADIDNNGRKELIVLDNDKIKIIDTQNGNIEEINIQSIFWSIVDFTFYRDASDNPMLALIQEDNIILYNLNTESIALEKEFENEYFTPTIDAFTMEDNGLLSTYFAINNNGIEIYDNALELVMKLPKEEHAWPHISSIFIHDTDNDQKPNLLASYKYKVVDYNLDLPGTYNEYFQIQNHYPQEGEIVDIDASLFIQFDAPVMESQLLNHLRLINVDDESELTFEITTKDNYTYEIMPTQPLVAGMALKISISDQLTSLHNEVFSIDPSIENAYEISFFVESQPDPPIITLQSNNVNRLYNKSKHLLKFGASTNMASTPIRSARYGYKGEAFTSILPNDLVFDEDTESFNFLLDGFDRPLGTNNFQIIAESYSGELDTLEMEFEIVTEQGIPYKRTGVNNHNTYYQERDSIGHKYELVWTLNIQHEDVFDANAAFGEGEYIYLRKSIEDSADPTLYFHKVEKNTGNIVYKNEIGFDADSGNFVLDNGQAYICMNEYSAEPMLKCIDTDKGEVIWETEFRNQSSEEYSPVVTDSYILMSGGKSGGVYCFDRWTGQELWFNPLEQSSDWSPSYYNGIVYTSAEGIISAFEVETGVKLWERDFLDHPSFGNSSPIIDTENNQLIYYNGEEVFAISLEDQTINWTYSFDTFMATFGLAENSLYAKNFNTLYRIDATSGSTISSIESPSATNEMLIAGNLVIVNGNDGTFMYDRLTLAPKGSIPEMKHAMSLVDDMLFFSNSSEVKAYRLLDQCFEYTDYSEFLCFGDSLFFNNVVFSESGTYTDTITNNIGCDQIATLNLTFSTEVITPATLINIDTGNGNGSIAVFPSGGQEPYTYNWDNGATTQLNSDLSAGIYNLTITDDLQCPFYFSFEVPLASSTQDTYTEVSLYPNLLRSGDVIFVNNLPIDLNNTVSLYNTSSELVKEIALIDGKINLPQDLTSGIYFIKFSSGDTANGVVKRIVVY